jgi:hypothetical protein
MFPYAESLMPSAHKSLDRTATLRVAMRAWLAMRAGIFDLPAQATPFSGCAGEIKIAHFIDESRGGSQVC